MTKEELKERTKNFALMIIKLVEELPNTTTGRTIGKLIIRFGTSVAANYRSAGRAMSNADFISNTTIVELTAIFTASGKTSRQNNPNCFLAKQKSSLRSA